MSTFIGDPPGTLKAYAAGSPPSGYLMCDGAAVSRATYAVLWQTIGSTYGVGDGSTTFNVPDLRGRVPVGVGSHADVSALGSNDGAAIGDRRVKHKHTKNGTVARAGSVTKSGTVTATYSPYVQTGNISNNDGPYVNKSENAQNTLPVYGTLTINDGISINDGITINDTITVGPQTNVPTDGPAYVTFNYIIKV